MSPFGKTPAQQVEPIWPAPTPLPTQPSVPHLDINLIPDAVRPWILDASRRLGVPPEAILVAALVALGTVAGSTLRVFPKANDESWSEAPNLYALLIAPPSTKKTPALNEGLRFLKKLEATNALEHSHAKAWRNAEVDAAKLTLKDIAAELATENDESAQAELKQRHNNAQARLEAAQAGFRRYLIMDATVEKTGILLAQAINRGGVLTMRDEFSGLLATTKRSGHENDRAFFLEGYNGTNPYTTDRVSRESISIPVLTLSMLGGIQPTQIEPMIRATRDQQVDDGLLERFQTTVWMEPNRCSIGLDVAPQEWAVRQASAAFEKIAASAAEREAVLDPYDFEGVHFTEAAQQHMDEWWCSKHDEALRAAHEGHAAYSSHLGKGQAAAARLALILHLLDRTTGGTDAAISLDQAQKATKLMDFFHAHARRTYSAHVPPSIDKLRELKHLIDRGDVRDGTDFRDLQRNHRTLGKCKGDQLVVLRDAEERGWLRLETVPNKGAKASTIIRLNPNLD